MDYWKLIIIVWLSGVSIGYGLAMYWATAEVKKMCVDMEKWAKGEGLNNNKDNIQERVR